MRATLAIGLVALGAACTAEVSVPHPDCDPADAPVQAWRSLFTDRDGDGLTVGPASPRCLLPDADLVELGLVPVSSGEDCDDADRTRFLEHPYAGRDRDLDGHATAVEPGLLCAGEELPPTWTATASGDCHDGDPERWVIIEVFADRDLDGYGDGDALASCSDGTVPPGFAARGGDCAPGDPDRSALLSYRYRDADGDGWTVEERSTVCGGAELPAGYALSPGAGPDCDDGDDAAYRLRDGYPDVDGDGRGVPPLARVCSGRAPPVGYAAVEGDCAPLDPTTWAVLAYGHRDADGDGWTVVSPGQICAAALPAGYATVASGDDCDDTDPAGEVLRHVYRDDDGDHFGGEDLGHVCTSEPLAPGYSAAGGDCDDADSGVWALLSVWLDADLDGVGAGMAGAVCALSAPAGFARVDGDCEPADPALWALRAAAAFDGDGDGVPAALVPPVQLCSGAALPAGYAAQVRVPDCDDARPEVYRWLAVFADLDGDGVGAGAATVSCLADAAPAGMARLGHDPDDSDPAVTDDLDEVLTVLW